MDNKILIVDDAAFMRMMIKDTLKKNGYENLLEAADGEIAVQTYKADALKEIRQMDPNAKIVMCSAMGQESMVVEAIRNGARDFIVKPFKAERVLKTVQGILG